MSDEQRSQPPPLLPANPAEFFRAGPGIDALESAASSDQRPALERLGPTPFRKSKFPLLGFLATVYEHVAAQSGGEKRTES